MECMPKSTVQCIHMRTYFSPRVYVCSRVMLIYVDEANAF